MTAPTLAPAGRRRRRLLAILAVYVVVNLAILLLAVPRAAQTLGADASSWIEPARALLEHGAFVELDHPDRPITFRAPLYPLFLAGLLWPGQGYLPLVLAQLALLFVTGLLVRWMVEPWLPGYGALALALVVFNPSALGTAHLVQSDTLYAFLMTAATAALLAFARAPGPWPALATGAAFALACLTRTTAQYLFYVFPLIFPILGWAAGHGRDWLRHLGAGAAALILAAAILAPWMAHNQAAGEGFALSTARLKSAFLWDNIAYLEKYHRGISLPAAERAAARERAAFAARQGPAWQGLGERQRYERLLEHGAGVFFSYPPAAFARAYAWAWAQFFGIPGMSNLVNILGLSERSPFAVFRESGHDTYLAAGLEALRDASPLATVLTLLGFVFVLALRALGLVGLGVMVARRAWPPLLVAMGGIVYFALLHLFVANSRYRLPIEPLLILLALYGLDGLRRGGKLTVR